MALSPQLLQFKSSGVYRLEFDKSQTVNIPAETIRLVVGRSKKGPYNTPVFIENIEQFTQVFGGIDKSLEKKGMYFHRSCIETLSRGPILALNLTAVDAADRIALVSPATNSSEEGLAAASASVQYSSIFDTDKFWVPSDLKTLNAASNTSSSSDNAITFANIKQEPITVIVRQAANTSGFEMTAREWYGEGNVPEGVEDLEYVSDYLVDVFVFKGNFDAAVLNNDPTYGSMFNEKGLFRSELSKFTALREVSLVAQYTGSVIPEFQDQEGRQLYIETLVNLESRRTGLFCAINEEALERIDFVGNNFNIYQDYKVLSHRVEQDATSEDIALGKVAIVDGQSVTLKNTTALELSNAGITTDGFLRASIGATEFTPIDTITINGIDAVITTSDAIKSSKYEGFVAGTAATFNAGAVTVVDGDIYIACPEVGAQPAGQLITAGSLIVGQYLLAADAESYVEIASVSELFDLDGVNVVKIVAAGSESFSSTYAAASAAALTAYGRTASTSFTYTTIAPNSRAVMLPTQIADYSFNALGAGRFKLSAIEVKDTFDWTTVSVGMYIPADGGKLARIKRIIKTVNAGSNIYEFECHRPVSLRPSYALKRYEDSTTTYTMFPLAAATQTQKTIAELLTQLKPGNGLSNTLIDKDAITFRYVVDTFGSLEAGGILNKEEITQLCKERQNASAILNAPMVKEFKAATNPSFKDGQGAFDTRLVSTGGNLELNPTAVYTLPSLNEGANFGFYYSPGLNVLENGKTKIIPPAAYISNNYIDKYLDALPWSIIAGPRRGVVGGTGVQGLEFAYDKNDRDYLEPFGINPIVFERGVGLTIKGNKTAQQSIQSALSSAHVREAMIYIEDGLAEILKNYLFEFNNAQTRLEIKTLADSFMESVKKDGGVYDYRNIMDGTNNTNDVIDNNMGILDTFVEPVKGLEILVSRVTILNTGEIATGNFA